MATGVAEPNATVWDDDVAGDFSKDSGSKSTMTRQVGFLLATLDVMEDGTYRVRCGRCASQLDVLETRSGGRTVSVAGLGPTVERSPVALERFLPPGSGHDIICPACNAMIDPSAPHGVLPSRKPWRSDK